MPNSSWSAPTRRHLPIILIRGFGGLSVEDEKALAYQGFNDGTVYPQKRGENYIYEGLILRLLKHRWQYHDATNVVGYFANPVTNAAARSQGPRRSRCELLHRAQGGDRRRHGAAPAPVGG